MKKFINILIVTVLLGLTAFGVYFMQSKYALYSLETNSMAPMLPQNSIILAQKYKDQPLDVGTIITFRQEQFGKRVLVTHRIDQVHGDLFVLKGDNNVDTDMGFVHRDEVIAVYDRTLATSGGNILAFFMKNILVVVLLFILGYVLVENMISRKQKKLKENQDQVHS